MAFHGDLEPAFGAIKSAIERAQLTPLRIDREHFTDKICERILTEIRRCSILVADVTKHRGGVYFEAGYALALEKTVVWTCRESDFKEVHFDTRQYPHIIWNSPEDLTEKLYERLQYLAALKEAKR
jgi:nucleoside 2-deoxyribosyltransferase